MINILFRYSFPVSIIYAISFLIAIVVAIVLHEYAHGFSAYKCGDTTAKYDGRLSLNPIKHFDPVGFLLLVVAGFGWAKPVPVNSYNFTKPYKKSMVWVCISGVLTNLILAFLACPLYYLVLRFIPSSFFLFPFLYSLTYYLFIVNITLAVFNLLPIYPLDGFNLVSTLTRPYNKFVLFMQRYGLYILLAILIIGAIPYVGFSPIGWLAEKVSFPIDWFWRGIIFGF